MKAIDVLNTMEIEYVENVSRKEDMSYDGEMKLFRQQDGDVILTVCPPTEAKNSMQNTLPVSIEFCTSGGRSPNTLRALMLLMVAMKEDNKK